MNLEALAACLTSAPCAVTQISAALIVGTLLFLVAAGLSLIFGVLGVINFAHGGFYMLGAYFAFTAYKLSGSFIVALIAGSLGAGIFGVLFERLIISRVYGRGLLMQLLVCYALTLILDDGVKLIYGAEYRMMGMPAAFAVPPVQIAGAFIAALLIGFIRAFGAIGFPWFVEGLMFAIMALVLVVKPTGLLGREAA